MTPHALLGACLDIERDAGRIRADRWASRTLDIDIVRFGDLILKDETLTLPHPGLAQRDFWQREMAELADHV
jgi:2-amino-4-hydroxy-6-hydroxymethyldihydropteridine diphosphokinase